MPLKKRKFVKLNRPKNQFYKSLQEFGSLKMRKPVKTENLKTKILKIFQTARLCQTPKISQATEQLILKICQRTETVSSSDKLTANVGSYTQGRTAGDFLSSRKVARAERCTPKTTAAALDG